MADLSTTRLKLDGPIKERIERLRKDAMAAWDHYQTTGMHATAEEADAWLAKLEAGKPAVVPKCHV
jgi:predicted transcriptional regulator